MKMRLTLPEADALAKGEVLPEVAQRAQQAARQVRNADRLTTDELTLVVVLVTEAGHTAIGQKLQRMLNRMLAAEGAGDDE